MKAGDTVGGKYKLIQRLGSGAMGVVWEAVNERMGRKVALKLILNPTDDLRQRLLREARVCGSLNHPNIVEVYDVGETDDGDPFLVMQLLTGETLADMLDRKKRIEPPTLAARICRDIASALDAAHSAKVIHRDLKPANIFLQRDADAAESAFTVKVLDFGVSKTLGGNDGAATMTGMMVGSPAYMSPEHVSMAKGLDHRTDIWSLGIILYELLTGVRPFVGRAIEDVVHQILSAPIMPVSNRVRNVPPALDELVARCLERDRNKRFQDAKSVARALAAVAEVSQVSQVMVNPPAPASTLGRAPMGSTPDAGPASAGRAAMGSNPDGGAPPVYGRPMMGSAPAMTEHLASTMPLQNTLPLPRQSTPIYPGAPQGDAVSGTQPTPGGSLTGTQILSPMDPIASPMPAWRLEMQRALATSRQGAEAPSASSTEHQQSSDTVAFPSERIPGYAAAVRQTSGVTTTTAPTMQPSGEAAIPGAPASEAAERKRSRGLGAWVYAAVGAGIVSIGALLVVIALGGPSDKADGTAAPSAAPEQAQAPKGTAVPAPKETATPAPKGTATPAPEERAMAAPAAPSVTATAPATPPTAGKPPAQPPVATTPPPVAQGNASGPRPPGVVRTPTPTPTPTPTVKGPMPKPCGKFVKTNCYQPKGI